MLPFNNENKKIIIETKLKEEYKFCTNNKNIKNCLEKFSQCNDLLKIYLKKLYKDI